MYYSSQVQFDQGFNTCPLDHDSTFHVAEMPALTTRPLVASGIIIYMWEQRAS